METIKENSFKRNIETIKSLPIQNKLIPGIVIICMNSCTTLFNDNVVAIEVATDVDSAEVCINIGWMLSDSGNNIRRKVEKEIIGLISSSNSCESRVENIITKFFK